MGEITKVKIEKRFFLNIDHFNDRNELLSLFMQEGKRVHYIIEESKEHLLTCSLLYEDKCIAKNNDYIFLTEDKSLHILGGDAKVFGYKKVRKDIVEGFIFNAGKPTPLWFSIKSTTPSPKLCINDNSDIYDNLTEYVVELRNGTTYAGIRNGTAVLLTSKSIILFHNNIRR